MTAVLFKFSYPDGTPVADAPFLVTTRKASFDETLDNGIQMPGDVNGLTDAQGEATLDLMPGFATYYLFMSQPGAEVDPEGCTTGLRYRFMVVDSVTPINVEDLIVTSPTWSRPWDETALQIIIDAKIAAQASADAAEISQGLAEASAVRAEDAEAATLTNATAAAASALAASQSEVAAHTDMLTTEGYRTEAEASKNAAAASAAASAASADFASGAVVDMQAQVDEATLQATNAGASAGQSAASALAAAGSETTALGAASATAADVVTTTANKDSTAADVITVTGLKSDVTALKDETLGYRDQAITAVGSLGAIIVNGGPVDLSGGAYPAIPEYSTMWKVTVGGTVAGAQGDTYGVGDTLMYAAQQDLFYKIDNTENVSEVNGQTGAVILGKADIGLANVDNTADIDKPLSTAAISANTAQNVAVADSLALKVAIADIINNLASTETNKPLSAAQGKVLYDLVQANNATIVRYTYTLTPGQTEITGNDLNGVALSYVPGTPMLVELNGFPLWLTNDYTATNGSTLTLTSGAEETSELAITVFGSFSVANHYTKAETDSLVLNGFPAVTVTSAATTNIGSLTSEVVNVSGTTAITSFGPGVDGARKTLRFSSALVITHNPTSLILLGSANIATAVGDSAEVLSLGGSNWIMLNYRRANGKALAFAYDRSNIVAPVSDGGGVPTGGVIQSYSAGAWSVIKWADGTMIMTGSFTAVNPAANTYVNTTFNAPEPFSNAVPVIGSYSLVTNSNGATAGLVFINVTGVSCTVQHCFNTVSTSTVAFTLIGRWKGF